MTILVVDTAINNIFFDWKTNYINAIIFFIIFFALNFTTAMLYGNPYPPVTYTNVLSFVIIFGLGVIYFGIYIGEAILIDYIKYGRI